jgi:hypothetical protein
MLKRLSVLAISTALAIAAITSAHAAIPLRPQIDVTGYVIHANLEPSTGKLSATAAVTFTALEDLDAAVFGLNNALQIETVSDGAHSNLACVRNVTDSTVSVTPAAVIRKGSSATWTFTYAGVPAVGTSPVGGIDFVQVRDPVSRALVSDCVAGAVYRPLHRGDSRDGSNGRDRGGQRRRSDKWARSRQRTNQVRLQLEQT